MLLRGMWDLPGPGIESVSPALAGGFLTTVPPGKSLSTDFRNHYWRFDLKIVGVKGPRWAGGTARPLRLEHEE